MKQIIFFFIAIISLSVSHLYGQTNAIKSNRVTDTGVIGDTLKTQKQNDTISDLQQVEIIIKSSSRELKESAQTVSVVDTRNIQMQSTGSIGIITKVMGINVRQGGGLGAEASISINGLGGKQVKSFINGIPSAYLGSGLGIHVLPVSVIDRIEIYKGVVPIELGTDALGGAINIVTRKNVGNYLDASYAIGSFNTHKACINSFYQPESSAFFVSVNSFYNYSDNNYRIDADIPDEKGNPVRKKVKRFHDRYQNYLLSAETGITKRSWADLLSVVASYSGMNDQVQHNATNAEQPYGKVTQQENALYSAFKFQKYNLREKLDVKLYGAYNRISSLAVDTSVYTYTWDGKPYLFLGNPVIHPTTGERSSNRKLLFLNNINTIAQVNLKYKFNATAIVCANVISTIYERNGHDTIQEKYFGHNYFSTPEQMFKTVSGISFEKKWLHNKLTSVTSVKQYYYKANGFEINEGKEQVLISQAKSKTGWNEAFRFYVNERLMLRSSYEYATRLPDVSEAFGDFLDTKPNPGILPETSHNFNTGVLYTGKKVGLEVNGFFRNTDQIIYLKTSRFISQNQNLLKAQAKGLEAEVNYKPFECISFCINATYQDIRNKSRKENLGTGNNRYYNARMPNIPYLFGNAEVRFFKKQFLKKLQHIQIWWNTTYVHEFYLYWANDGDKDKKAIVPHQLTQNAGVSSEVIKDQLSISLEIFNLTDVATYDNFNIQKPGRNYSLKLRYFISKNNTVN